MRVDQATIYKFFFSYEGTELMIPMAGASQEEAMAKLRGFMLGWSNELTVNTLPTLSPVQINKLPEEKMPDPFTLQLRIEELVKILIPLKKPKGAQTVDRLVKEWTGFPMEPANYPSIIAELGRISPHAEN